jgi:long-chain acyl-CoA synthetase
MSRFWEDACLCSSRIRDGEQGWVFGQDLAIGADKAVSHLPRRTLFALKFSANLASVLVYLGALRNGHVPLLVNIEMSTDMLNPLCMRFGIGYLFDGASWSMVGEGDSLPKVLHPSLGLLLSTSGSTGSPKLVRLSLENLSANANSILTYLSLTADDIAISSLPLSYSYGLSVLNSHIAVGGGVILSDAAVTTSTFWDLMRHECVTGLAGVPTTWRMLRRIRFDRMDLPALRYVTQAGGRLDPEEVIWLGEFARRTGRHAYIMYGQAEATARIAYLPPEYILEKPGSIGWAIPGGSLSLIASDGMPITLPDVEGQLVYEGPNTMLGYAESAQDLAEGKAITLLPTGDLARQDSEGFFWITGRIKRFIKLFGNRFSLDDVEQHIRSIGFDVGAVGRDDSLMIGIVAEPDSAEILRQDLAKYYRIHPSAIQVFALTALPRNSAGKLLQIELQETLDRLVEQGKCNESSHEQ